MTIFVDHQYLEIYNGEFRNYVEESIIKPLQLSHVVTVSKGIDDTRKLLSVNTYNIVILTGYSSEVLAMINVGKDTKIIPIVYDMTAEYILAEIGENEILNEIVMHKSRLMFISHKIICLNESVANQIIELYSRYKRDGVDIPNKISIVDHNYKFDDKLEIPKKLIKGKYIVLKESINGLTFVSQDFEKIFTDLLENEFPDITVAIVSEKFPKSLFYEIKIRGLENKIKVFKDVTKEQLFSLYKYSLFNMIISRFDNDIINLYDMISCDGLCLINESNIVFKDLLGESGNYYDNETINMNEIILELIRTPRQIVNELKSQQKEKLNEELNKKQKTINKALANLF